MQVCPAFNIFPKIIRCNEFAKLADLVIIDGNPLEDITVLQDHRKIKAVMKDGLIYQGLTNKINPYLNENL